MQLSLVLALAALPLAQQNPEKVETLIKRMTELDAEITQNARKRGQL